MLLDNTEFICIDSNSNISLYNIKLENKIIGVIYAYAVECSDFEHHNINLIWQFFSNYSDDAIIDFVQNNFIKIIENIEYDKNIWDYWFKIIIDNQTRIFDDLGTNY
jgi:hypothetical protein